MTTQVFYLPRQLDALERVLDVGKSMLEMPITDEYHLDFGRVQWVQPFALIFLATKIRQLCGERLGAQVYIQNYEHMSYAAYMGFFQASGVDHGNIPGQAGGSMHYLPITYIKRSDIDNQMRASLVVEQQIIENSSRRLARTLTQMDDGDLVEALTFSLREIIRNVFEHGEIDECCYCAQYWPTRGAVELVLMDAGIGIRASLSRNPNLTINNDHDAIVLSLMPGVSGKAFGAKRKKRNSVWDNSGFGLYMTSRLCGNGGTFFIASNSAGIEISEKGKTNYAADISGTIIRMYMKTDRCQRIRQQLADFAAEGERLARMSMRGGPISASDASKMLSADFKHS